MDIYFLEWDDDNEEHLAQHGITPRVARQLLANRHITVENPKAEDRFLVIGETHSGDVLTLSVAPTRDSGTWRPVTGWRATDSERKLFQRHIR